MTALRAACEKLVEAINRREKHGHELIERRRDEPVSLDAMREWPEHREWQRAIADEKDAQNAIRAALAEEKVPEAAQVPAKPAPAFKVGDRVRVVSERSAFRGECGEVVDVHPEGEWSVRVQLSDMRPLFRPSELSPAEVIP